MKDLELFKSLDSNSFRNSLNDLNWANFFLVIVGLIIFHQVSTITFSIIQVFIKIFFFLI